MKIKKFIPVKKCEKCGKPLPKNCKNQKYCSACGTRINAKETRELKKEKSS